MFDSLSDQTVWDTLRWQVDQHYKSQVPTTPVTIKWRVGNGPDPSLWLGDPTWYTWTIPFTVTCGGAAAGTTAGENSDNCDPTKANCGTLLDRQCDCQDAPGDGAGHGGQPVGPSLGGNPPAAAAEPDHSSEADPQSRWSQSAVGLPRAQSHDLLQGDQPKHPRSPGQVVDDAYGEAGDQK